MLTQSQYNAVTDDIASSIEPQLVAAIDANREQILSGVPVLTRWVANRMWSAILAMVPILARIALEATLSRFADVTIQELMSLIAARKARESKAVDPTDRPASN